MNIQENNSNESQLVHQIDKFEMAIQAKKYEQKGFSKEKLQQFYDSAKQEIHSSKIKRIIYKDVQRE